MLGIRLQRRQVAPSDPSRPSLLRPPVCAFFSKSAAKNNPWPRGARGKLVPSLRSARYVEWLEAVERCGWKRFGACATVPARYGHRSHASERPSQNSFEHNSRPAKRLGAVKEFESQRLRRPSGMPIGVQPLYIST